MKISTKGRYALRLMLELAIKSKGEYIALKDIADSQCISKKYLEQIVPLLTRSGLLKTNRGYLGGYMPAKEPSEYTVGEILRVTEGNLAPVTCLKSDPIECSMADCCLTIDVWKGLQKAITDYLDSITLQDIIYKNKEKGNLSL